MCDIYFQMENVKTVKSNNQANTDDKLLDVLNQIFPLTKPILQKSKFDFKSDTTLELQVNKLLENQETIFKKIKLLDSEVKYKQKQSRTKFFNKTI